MADYHYVAFGLFLALICGLIILAYIHTHPDDVALRKRAAKWRRKHPRT